MFTSSIDESELNPILYGPRDYLSELTLICTNIYSSGVPTHLHNSGNGYKGESASDQGVTTTREKSVSDQDGRRLVSLDIRPGMDINS